MRKSLFLVTLAFAIVPVLTSAQTVTSVQMQLQPTQTANQGQQSQSQSATDVFTSIGKYIEAGDSEKLSAWFADNLELDITGSVNSCTRSQAKLIMKNFFNNNTPKKFSIIHKSGRPPMSYAVGSLSAGAEKFRVIIYVRTDDGKNSIQQLRIEKD
ncbi:MAG: DUF4783 domain-containing protein [Bacteroidales bacterium]|nr:DUF4783 domain-containing protein [Bacteroidales bacterium]MBO7371041.1 DUF4783 domain-containing protein [Bacteroidales bacterium]MBP5316868.1 DUF4783 domain-containing protein [Bacteroidales bacterium]